MNSDYFRKQHSPFFFVLEAQNASCGVRAEVVYYIVWKVFALASSLSYFPFEKTERAMTGQELPPPPNEVPLTSSLSASPRLLLLYSFLSLSWAARFVLQGGNVNSLYSPIVKRLS